jgi:hypothetical protein
MSISILNRGASGASGGLKPEIIVTAPVGSTIDLLQGGIVIDTYTLSTSETEHIFFVNKGAYTVRGMRDTTSKSVDVVVDEVAQYNVQIAYKLWLYHAGDECEEVTGGWAFTDYGNGSLVKNSDHMILTYKNSTALLSTRNQSIPNPDYRTFYAEVKASTSKYQNLSVNYGNTGGYLKGSYITSTSYYTQTLDVSAYLGKPFNIEFKGEWYNSDTGSIYIKNVWLE